jgi:hypothetical protein
VQRIEWRWVNKWRATLITTLMALTHINFTKGLPMKHTIEELHFAAQVRDLAGALRNGATPVAESGEWKSPAFLATLEQWHKDNPFSDFVAKALKLIEETADVIKALQSE